MFGINMNLVAEMGRRHLDNATRAAHQSMERLATGQRINRSSDDPAGMITAEQLNIEQRIIEKQLERIDLEEHRLGALDGAHGVIDELIIELNGLVVQAANRGGLADGEPEALQAQVDSILQTIDHLAATTVFNGERILLRSGARDLGVVMSSERQEDGTYATITRTLAALASGGELNLIDGDLEGAQRVAQAAIESGATYRAGIGARLKQLESGRAELLIRLENIAAARSEIVDTDFAAETAALVRAQMLQQAAIFVQQTALKQTADLVLRLLQ